MGRKGMGIGGGGTLREYNAVGIDLVAPRNKETSRETTRLNNASARACNDDGPNSVREWEYDPEYLESIINRMGMGDWGMLGIGG